MQYQTLRSVSDHHGYVICRDGKFSECVPAEARKQGPWQGQHREAKQAVDYFGAVRVVGAAFLFGLGAARKLKR
jgi:hypothetical protein